MRLKPKTLSITKIKIRKVKLIFELKAEEKLKVHLNKRRTTNISKKRRKSNFLENNKYVSWATKKKISSTNKANISIFAGTQSQSFKNKLKKW